MADPAPPAGVVLRPTHFRVLGTQPAPGRPGWHSALDVAIRTSDGTVRVGGLRTADWFTGDRRGAVADTDFDPATVRYWDFGRLLWVGPSDHPRLVWSNAVAITVAGVATLLHSPGGQAFVAGPDGRGLPPVELLGLDLGDDIAEVGEPITVDW